jgi:hypothetical protein
MGLLDRLLNQLEAIGPVDQAFDEALAHCRLKPERCSE